MGSIIRPSRQINSSCRSLHRVKEGAPPSMRITSVPTTGAIFFSQPLKAKAHTKGFSPLRRSAARR